MLEAVLPRTAATAEAFGDPPDAILLDAEEAAVRHAVARRRNEFTTGRHCARQALEALGRTRSAILRGPRGEPQWPAGVVGAITHCVGYRACALGETRDFVALGIDAEPCEALPSRVRGAIAYGEELEMLGALDLRHPGLPWDRLLFSAKESVYKAWSPLAHRWLGFEDACLTVEPDDGSFTARLLVPGPFSRLSGRWLCRDGLIVTAVAVEAT